MPGTVRSKGRHPGGYPGFSFGLLYPALDTNKPTYRKHQQAQTGSPDQGLSLLQAKDQRGWPRSTWYSQTIMSLLQPNTTGETGQHTRQGQMGNLDFCPHQSIPGCPQNSIPESVKEGRVGTQDSHYPWAVPSIPAPGISRERAESSHLCCRLASQGPSFSPVSLSADIHRGPGESQGKAAPARCRDRPHWER